MCGLRRLRSLAGKLSWAAGILRRSKWSVNIIFVLVASAVADLRRNAEERRKQQRQDQRDKRHLVVSKRVKLPLTWWEALLSSIRIYRHLL
eukprot:856579-Amphidinium_carterae.2